MTAKFTIHHEGATYDLALRISVIENGFVIKAGEAPFFCSTKKELDVAVADIMATFVSEVTTMKITKAEFKPTTKKIKK